MTALKRIVYVEDEPDIQTVAKIALEMVGGFELLICSSGAEAIEKAASFAPQLLLLDVMMPGMDGPTTMHHLREQGELTECPVVFMTAKARPSEVNTFLDLGAVAVISKPFDPMSLSAQLQTIWQQHESKQNQDS